MHATAPATLPLGPASAAEHTVGCPHPSGLGDGRYWDGQTRTPSVSRAGLTITAPIDESLAALPPTPGSEFLSPMPQAATPPAAVATTKRSPVGAIVAVLVAVLVVVLIAVLVNDDSSNDDPTPATTPPATAPAATSTPSSDG